VRDQNTINFLTQQFPNPFFGLNSVFTANISRASLLQPYPEFGNVSVLQPQGFSASPGTTLCRSRWNGGW
jgi:hypothetical protein